MRVTGNTLRRLEGASAILAAIFGEVGLARSLVLPASTGQICTASSPTGACTAVTMTYLVLYGRPALVKVAFLALVLLCIASAGIWHCRTGRNAPGILLLLLGGFAPIIVASSTFQGATLTDVGVVCLFVACLVAVGRILTAPSR
jgi:hypothetical protein